MCFKKQYRSLRKFYSDYLKEPIDSFRGMIWINLAIASLFSAIISIFAFLFTLGDFDTAYSVFVTFWWLIFLVSSVLSLLPTPKWICHQI
jgi:hypothetical protein